MNSVNKTMQSRVSPGSGRRNRLSTPEAPQRTNAVPSGDTVISTFANVDLRVAKAAMNDYARSCEVMARENEQLRLELQRQEEESIKVVEHLKEKLEEARNTVMEQQNEINRLQHEGNEATEAVRRQYTQMLGERDEQVAQYAALTQRLQTEMRACARSIHLREESRLEVQRLRDQIEEMTARHESELSALRFQTVDRKMRLLALEETMRESHQARVEHESSLLLEKKSHELLKNYRELQEERTRLVKDIDELMQLTTMKAAEFVDERRKGDLHQHACEEALRRIANSNKRSCEMQMKTQRLEQHVKELLQEKKSLREELSRQYEGKIQALERALAETQSSLRCHRTELQRMRYAASKIVEQRSDLEKFFYVALNDVRKMRTKSSKNRGNTPHSTSHTSPSMSLHSNSTLKQCASFSSKLPQLSPPQKAQQAEPNLSSRNSAVLSASTGETRLQPHSPCVPAPPPPVQEVCASATSAAGKQARQERPAPLRRAHSNGTKPTQDAPVRGTVENVDSRLHINLGEDGKGVYLNDLSWDDKEKIIKALLFFINQTCYQPLSKTGGENVDEPEPVTAN